WSCGRTVTGAEFAFFDNADLEGVGTPPTTSTWVIDGSGDWNVSGNWANGTVPNGVDKEADLLGAITSNHTVFSDIGVSVGILNFDNAHTYVVAGAGSLTMDVSAGSAQINVNQGSQKINLPLRLNDSTVANVAG